MKRMRRWTSLLLTAVMAMHSMSALAFESIKKGDQNTDVQVLQMRLNDLGYSVGTVDGDFGGKTFDAVSSFQQDHGLDVTGEVDEVTWDALYDEAVTITQEGASVDVLLTAPFLDISAGNDGAILEMNGAECTVKIFDFGMDISSVLSEVEDLFHKSYDDEAVPNYQASNLNSDISMFDVDGRAAGIYTQIFDFVNGENLRNYSYWAGMEIESENGMPLIVAAQSQSVIGQDDVSLITAERVMDVLRRIRVKDQGSESTGNESGEMSAEETASEAPTEQEEVSTDDLFRAAAFVKMHNDYINSRMGYQDYVLVPRNTNLDDLAYETAVYSNILRGTAIGYSVSFHGLDKGEEDTVTNRIDFIIDISDELNYITAMQVLGETLENIAQEDGLVDWMLNTALTEVVEKLDSEEKLETAFEGKHISLHPSLNHSSTRDYIRIVMEPVYESEVSEESEAAEDNTEQVEVNDEAVSEDQDSAVPAEGEVTAEDFFKASSLVQLNNDYCQYIYPEYELVPYQTDSSQLTYVTTDFSTGESGASMGYTVDFPGLKQGEENDMADQVIFTLYLAEKTYYANDMMYLGIFLEENTREEGLEAWIAGEACDEVYLVREGRKEQAETVVFEGDQIMLESSMITTEEGDVLNVIMKPVSGSEES